MNINYKYSGFVVLFDRCLKTQRNQLKTIYGGLKTVLIRLYLQTESVKNLQGSQKASVKDENPAREDNSLFRFCVGTQSTFTL